MLTLTIKKKWFDAILSGEKKEEYREIKPYYTSRFKRLWQGSLVGGEAKREIMFRNGYSKSSPKFVATCTIDTGPGKPEWGAEPDKEYYRLHIHEVVENGYLPQTDESLGRYRTRKICEVAG